MLVVVMWICLLLERRFVRCWLYRSWIEKNWIVWENCCWLCVGLCWVLMCVWLCCLVWLMVRDVCGVFVGCMVWSGLKVGLFWLVWFSLSWVVGGWFGVFWLMIWVVLCSGRFCGWIFCMVMLWIVLLWCWDEW